MWEVLEERFCPGVGRITAGLAIDAKTFWVSVELDGERVTLFCDSLNEAEVVYTALDSRDNLSELGFV